MSVCEIKETKIYDYETLQPNPGGLNDRRLGVSTRGELCETCEGTSIDCPGHWGYLRLARPVYHIGVLENVKKILNCVCSNCSRLIAPRNEDFENIQKIKDPRIKLREMTKFCERVRVCSTKEEKKEGDDNEIIMDKFGLGCGYVQPKYGIEKLTIKINPQKGNDEEVSKERPFFAYEALTIFQKISDEDCVYIGLDPQNTRPESLIITALPICPPQVRPSIQMDPISRSEDDLTHQYMQILKYNQEIGLLLSKGMPNSQIERQIEILQFYIATLMNNELNGMPQSKHKSGKPIKSIRERLKGKEGRLRKNLMGKRVDFSARTVVSPDPNLAIDELGVPRSIALNLTIPETVTPLNIDRLKELVKNGPTEWPGAKHIIRKDGKMFDLRFTKNREDIQLNVGSIIERHIVDGDFVIFNRQPSLHRMSMMGHKIRILPYSSFRLNLSVTTPYNADFDGDEMNMHVPQTYETQSEIKYLMHVPNQIVSPQANKPVMGIVQDSLVGIRLLTRKDTFLTKEQMMNLLLWVDISASNNYNIYELPPPAIIKPKPLWTGKQILSIILPEVNLEKKCNVADKELDENGLFLRDLKVIIDHGELLTGMLDKGVVGNTSGGLLHYIWLDHKPEDAASFLNNAPKIVNNWLCIHGFSVGCSDILPDVEVQISIQDELKKSKDIVAEKLRDAENKKMDHQPGKSMLDSFEANVNNELNNIFKVASNKAQDMMNDKNRIYCMVAAGSKGSNLNIAQIMACVGQQNVEGRRIPFGFNKRTLPHFTKDDYGPHSRGFVINSYLTGLTPEEFFFHAMGGREGIIDTAVKTSETGYLQRRLIKALEDVMVKYDSTVRDCGGNIIQFLYGEDGMAGEYIEGYMQNFLELKNSEMIREFRFFDPAEEKDLADQLPDYERYFDPSILENLLSRHNETHEELRKEYEGIVKARNELRKIFPDFQNRIHLPVNLPRLIKNVKARHLSSIFVPCTLNPLNVIHDVKTTLSKLTVSVGKDIISQEAQKNGTYLIGILMKLFLSSKRLCIRDNLTPEMFYEIIGEIEDKFMHAKVHPGEMIGIICAQSLGEPTTQMTLNTFHFAGLSAKNVTLGVPRLKEILNVARKIKTPSMQIFINPEMQTNLEEGMALVKKLQSTLEYTTLGHLALSSELYFDPILDGTIIEDDAEIVNIYLQMPDEEDPEKVSSWLLRIMLDKNSIIDRNITLRDIKERINFHIPNLQIIFDSIALPEKPVIRIRLKGDFAPDEQANLLRGIEQKILEDLRLKGFLHVKKVFLKKWKRKYVEEDGSLKDKEEWMLETDGSNLRNVLALNEVDHTKTITNNNQEVYEVLGVEAARMSLIKEIRIILDAYGIYVNYRHLTTLCDIMTQRGLITSISRHGINRVIDGPFRRASFEQTVEILFSAGVFGEVQKVKIFKLNH